MPTTESLNIRASDALQVCGHHFVSVGWHRPGEYNDSSPIRFQLEWCLAYIMSMISQS